MFDFGNANEGQRKAISTTEGPVLITAGPGTGKTFTLVQRAIYLIQECGVKPEEIFIATFTEKAAKELITRITNELGARDISVNVNEMYVGTFHSICLRIIKEHLEYTRLKKNYRLLDSFDQQYLVFRHIWDFKAIANFEMVFTQKSYWKLAESICNFINNLSEEMVDVSAMEADSNPSIVVLAEVLKLYRKLLKEENLLDFSSIQTECYNLLKENPAVLKQLQDSIKYLMVDEYQDTNYIQEQIVFLLAGEKHNICVVGDDDQGLYRFRGATIRNILEFPGKFASGECKIVPLVINYRSDSDIVDFYNKWMNTTDGAKFVFQWGKFRYDKQIEAHESSKIKSPCVVKLSSENDVNEWYEKVLAFIEKLKASGKLTNYNQLAFLFNSVKTPNATGLATFLENHGVNVYSPRSNMFFQRDEIKLVIGFLLLMFPKYVSNLQKGEYKFLSESIFNYYYACIELASKYASNPENKELKRFVRQRGKIHLTLKDTTNYAYSGLLYQLFMFEPFKSILDTDVSVGVVDIRPARNLAMLTQIIGKFEYLHRVDVLNGDYIDKDTVLLFNTYLKLLIEGGITEYEDDSEYAPSGCVSFLTVHQAKGMEFPIVLVDSLSNVPKNKDKKQKDILLKVEQRYYHRSPFEPADDMKYFDFWRLYYTAFSRAQNLLVLTCNENNKTPSKYFSDIYKELPSEKALNLDEFTFQQVKNVNLKDTFSFTSQITVYETCALQYKFYKELEFMPVRQGAMLFGTLVHETIEDIHKAAIKNEIRKINEENIKNWFHSNYISLVKTQHGYLAEPQREAALNQVLRYAERQDGKWDLIRQAEVDVSLVQPEYIIEGKIDLVKGQGDTVELVDFKSEKKPDLVAKRDKIEQYRRQLHIYAYLIEQRTGHKVSRMNIYYTGEENGSPIISFPYTKTAIQGTMDSFDDTVHKILHKDFNHRCTDGKVCENCDFRFYCSR